MNSTSRNLTFAAAILALGLGQGRADDAPAEPAETAKPDPEAVRRDASYGIGLNFGRSLKGDGVELDVERFMAGLKAAYGDGEPELTDAQIRVAMQAFQLQVREAQRAKAEADAKKNAEEGEKFLAANAKKKGVKTTKSGLQYKVVEEGTGASPKATDVVKVHYHGTLIDGTVFDSSVERESPATFPLNRVISGWTEGLQLMKVGGKTTFYIPSELAYGKNPRPGGPIGPNSALVFEVELLEIIPK